MKSMQFTNLSGSKVEFMYGGISFQLEDGQESSLIPYAPPATVELQFSVPRQHDHILTWKPLGGADNGYLVSRKITSPFNSEFPPLKVSQAKTTFNLNLVRTDGGLIIIGTIDTDDRHRGPETHLSNEPASFPNNQPDRAANS